MTDVLAPRTIPDNGGGIAAFQMRPEPVPSRYPFDIPYGWFQVAWSHELAPGEVLARYYFGRHLVVWRDLRGEVHVNDAFCPHLGAHFAYGGHVEDCQLVCPFHGWKFDAAGNNTDIPYGNRPNRKANVRPYPVREIADALIVAWYHPHGVAPLFELDVPPEASDDDFSEWTFRHFSVNAAAQEMAENAVDGPHFRYVHNTEIVPEIESYVIEGHQAHMRSIQKFPTPRGVVDGRIDVDNQGPGFGITRFSGIVDTFLVGAATPIDANRAEVRFSFRTRKLGDSAATSSVSRAFVDEVCKQFEEDRPVWENKAHISKPALADTDPPFMKFRKWYSQFYADGVRADAEVWDPLPPTDYRQPPPFEKAQLTASAKYRESD